MRAYLVHHADALGPDVDPQRPLSNVGLAQAEQLARRIKAAGFAPAMVWHSGKLRARQTAEAIWRAANPFATFTMIRGLHPDDPPEIVRDALLRESGDVLIVGHMPNLDRVRTLLSGAREPFPTHGLVALESADAGVTWTEVWKTGR
jgi:phosphohistidine phosphatase